MSFSLLPQLILPALPALTPQMLSRRGIQLLMLDFDNTIVPYTTDEPTKEMALWLERMQNAGIPICVVSNSKRERVRLFCQRHGLDCITHAKKPAGKGIYECLRRYGMEPNQAALVGDQIYTDVLGANCAGVYPILVHAIHNHTIWLKLRHAAEMPFILLARGRRVKVESD